MHKGFQTRSAPIITWIVAATVLLALLVPLSLGAGVSPASAEHTTCAPNVQFLGFSDALNKSKFGGFDVTELSGLAYDDLRGVYYAVADRAGATPTHFFTLDIPVGSEAIGPLRVLGVTVLNTDQGTPFTGFTFDGEGIVLTRGDELIVASESGSAADQQPEMRRFSLNGTTLGELSVAPRFLIGPNNLSFESLALSPNGHTLFTANERPLAGDGRTGDLRSRIRIVRYEDRGAQGFVPAQEYLYLTEPGRTTADLGVAELIALSEEDLLVLERGFVSGKGNTIRVFRVSVKNAADVSNVSSLSAGEPVPLAKSLLFDLVNCPASGATNPGTQPNPLLDNFEAMALGPQLPGGRRVLLLMSDDNENDTQVTRVVALAIPVAAGPPDIRVLVSQRVEELPQGSLCWNVFRAEIPPGARFPTDGYVAESLAVGYQTGGVHRVVYAGGPTFTINAGDGVFIGHQNWHAHENAGTTPVTAIVFQASCQPFPAGTPGLTQLGNTGPLPGIKPGVPYLLQLLEGRGKPGDQTPVQSAPGPLAVYVLEGAVDASTPAGVGRLTAGNVAVVPTGTPFQATSRGDRHLAVLLTPAADPPLRVKPPVEELQSGGYVILFRHSITDRAQRDTSPTDLANCATQRNLTEAGRAAARAIGEGFRKYGIPVGQVLSSPYCRTLETARLAFGRADASDALLILGFVPVAGAPVPPSRDQRLATAKQLVATVPSGKTNSILVAHSDLLPRLTGLDVEEGEAVILKPDGKGATVVGRVLPQEWSALSLQGAAPAQLPRTGDGFPQAGPIAALVGVLLLAAGMGLRRART